MRRVTISNEQQFEQTRARMDELAKAKRTDEEDGELADLIAAINAWQLLQAQPVQPIRSADEYDRAKTRIHELSDAPEGTPEAIELAGLVEAANAYDEKSRSNPLARTKPGDVAKL